MSTKIKRAQRRALSKVIASAAIMVQTVSTLALKTDEFPDSLTEREFEYMKKLRTRVFDDSQHMLKFAHRLRD